MNKKKNQQLGIEIQKNIEKGILVKNFKVETIVFNKNK